MSDVRLSGGEGDGAAQLLASARARVAAAAADLALPQGLRLSDRQRTTMLALLADLVRSVEAALRAELAPVAPGDALQAALSSAHVEIAVPVLAGDSALAEPPLIDLLLRRAEEHRLHRAAAGENALLVELAGDSDEAVAREAMALLIAQNGRLDGFGEPILPRSDLPAELDHHLVWTVAAALRRYMVGRHAADPALCDAAVAAAASRVLAGHDEGETVEARAMRLALALRDAGRLDEPKLLARGLTQGSLPLFLALLAVRTSLGVAAVWELLSAASGPVLLLRAARLDRPEAAAILLAWGLPEPALADALDRLDGTSEAAARSLLTLWRADPGYRAAVARLAA
jgi:Uncharacterised protein conserved in bacteria (DUF2336)